MRARACVCLLVELARASERVCVQNIRGSILTALAVAAATKTSAAKAVAAPTKTSGVKAVAVSAI